MTVKQLTHPGLFTGCCQVSWRKKELESSCRAETKSKQ